MNNKELDKLLDHIDDVSIAICYYARDYVARRNVKKPVKRVSGNLMDRIYQMRTDLGILEDMIQHPENK